MADLPMSKIESGIENRKPNQSEIFSLSVGRKNHAVHSITAARTSRKGLSSPELDHPCDVQAMREQNHVEVCGRVVGR